MKKSIENTDINNENLFQMKGNIMSDSNNTNELDSYGVWVKTPPKTVDSSNETSPADTLDLNNDLPDFSDLDVIDEPLTDSVDYDNNDTALSAEELSAIAGVTSDTTEEIEMPESFENITETPVEPSSSGEEEISLDEFLDGGMFETGPDEDKVRQHEADNPSESAPSESETEDVDLSDFGVEESETTEPAEDSVQEVPAATSGDDDIFDIDLSFDDAPVPAATENFVSEPAPAAFESEDNPAGTESVDLSEFGLDDFNDSPAAETETSTDDGGMESVDLSEFGFDDIEESPQEEKTESAETEETSAEEEATIMESPAEDDLGFTVQADDEDVPLEADSVSDATPAADFTTQEDDDFDVDALLGDVTDENGNKVSIGNPEDNIVKEVADIPSDEPAMPIESETIEEFSIEETETAEDNIPQEIPDTFDEETASFLDDSEPSDATSFAETIKAPILDEIEDEVEKPSTQMTAIFNQIVGELTSLKNEIASLKNDLATMKESTPAPSVAFEDTITPPVPAEEPAGFFADTDEDDTIALSTDELDNILNNADITEAEPSADTFEDEIEPSSELPDEIAEESILGNIDSNVDIPEEDFESTENLSMDSMDFNEENAIEEPVLDDIDYTDPEVESELPEEITLPKSDDILVESSSTDFMDASEANEVFDDITAEDPSISESLTDENLDFLSETPVEEPEVQTEVNTTGNDLTSEIKSVLSYMDQLLENLPEEKIAEFAQSEQFDTYKKLFKELGLA